MQKNCMGWKTGFFKATIWASIVVYRKTSGGPEFLILHRAHEGQNLKVIGLGHLQEVPGSQKKICMSSRPGEFHPKPLTEPYVIVAHHTALIIQSYAVINPILQWANSPEFLYLNL